MKRLFFLIFILLTLIVNFNATELKLKSMAATGNYDLYLIPDVLCDSFFVNPSYANETDKVLLNIYNSFDLMFNFVKYTDPDYNEQTEITFDDNYKNSFIIPHKNFSFGIKTEIDVLYYKNNLLSEPEEYTNSYDNTHKVVKIYPELMLNFSWKIKDNINFGFNTSIKGTLFDNYTITHEVDHDIYFFSDEDEEEYYRDSYYSKNKIYLNYLLSFGYLVKNEKYNLSFSFPLYYNFIYTSPFDYYDVIYQQLSIGFNTGLKLNLDYFFNDKIIIRFPFQFLIGFTYRNLDLNINNNYNVEGFFVYYCITPSLKSAVSFNNKINDRVFLLYGFDLNFNSTFNAKKDDDLSEREFKFEYTINSGVGTFIGGEFILSKYLNLRLGINAEIIKIVINKYKNYLPQDDAYDTEIRISDNDDYFYSNYRGSAPNLYYYNYEVDNISIKIFPDINIKTGLAFKVKDWLDIEMNLNFLNISFEYLNSKVDIDDDYRVETSDIYIEFDMGFFFKINKKSNEINK